LNSYFRWKKNHSVLRQSSRSKWHQKTVYKRLDNEIVMSHNHAFDTTQCSNWDSVNIVKKECLSESVVQSEVRLDCWQFFSAADAHRSIESLEFWYSNMNINKTKIKWIWIELAIKTRLSYDSTIKIYKKHCMIWDFLIFSAIIKSLRSWVFTFDTRELKIKNIKTYLTEIKSYHVNIKHFDETLRIFHNNVL
jgi:hypothetical protein